MTDYTDLIAQLRSEAETAAYAIEPATFYLKAAAAIAALTAERDALQAHIAQEAEFLATVTTAKHEAEREVARVTAIAERALNEWASWVHDQLDGTGDLADAIAEVNEARAALTAKPQPAIG